MKVDIVLHMGDKLSVSLEKKTNNNSSQFTPMEIKYNEDGSFTTYCDFPIDHRPFAGSAHNTPFYEYITNKQNIEVYTKEDGLCVFELPKNLNRVIVGGAIKREPSKEVIGFDSKSRQYRGNLIKHDKHPAITG